MSESMTWEQWASQTAEWARSVDQRTQALQDLGVQLSTSTLRLIDRMDRLEDRMNALTSAVVSLGNDVTLIKEYVISKDDAGDD